MENKCISPEEHFDEFMKEKQKHLQKEKSILESLSYIDIKERNDRIVENFEEINDVIEEIKEDLTIVINNKFKNKDRVCINKEITVRDGGVFEYNKRKKASIIKLCRNKEEIVEKIQNRRIRRNISRILSEIESLEETRPIIRNRLIGSLPWWFGKNPIVEYEKNNYFLYRYPRKKWCNGRVYIKKGYNNYNSLVKEDLNHREAIPLEDMDKNKAMEISVCKEELFNFLDEVKEETNSKKQELKEIKEDTESTFSKELVIDKL